MSASGKRKASDETQAIENTAMSASERMAQFKALRMRAKDSKKQNRTALVHEHARMKEDPKALKALDLKKSLAAEKLVKLDALEAGQDADRKKAWDWSIAESQAWDTTLAERAARRDKTGFASFADEAAKQYERNTRNLKPDLAAYQAEKAQNGTLVRAEDGVNDVTFIQQKPDKENVDRLIADLSKADAARLKAKNKRGRGVTDAGDYISDRNKVFNQKVARFYDKYTKEMKESFERGTAS